MIDKTDDRTTDRVKKTDLMTEAERFTGPDAAAANALLTRQYRKSFEVPQVA